MVLSGVILASCSSHDLYQGSESEQKQEKSGAGVAAQFSNYEYVEVDITSQYSGGRYYAIYAQKPYSEEGDLTASPLLTGCTPINETVSVPAGVQTLYVYNDEGVKEYALSSLTGGKLTLTDAAQTKAMSTRAASTTTMTPEELRAAIRQVRNELLPEKCFNVRGEEMYKCGDLEIKDLESDQKAHVYLTLIYKDPTFRDSKVWYYTYTRKDNPSIDDLTFYGKKEDGTIEPVTYQDIRDGKYNVVAGRSDNFDRMEEFELPSEAFANGVNLGFVYSGNMGPKFTTPSLNIKENGCWGVLREDNCTDDYIGETINYGDGTKFTIEKRIAGGALLHFDCLSKEYNVVGLENRLPNQHSYSYDGDFNDLLLLIRSNPETIKPKEEITVVKPVPTLYREGVWLFEDNFPNTGDFDFNDVVMAYRIMKAGELMTVTCKVVAKGCTNNNELGLMVLKSEKDWQNPVDEVMLWDNVQGYLNVYDNVALDFGKAKCPSKTVKVVCGDFKLLRPYLYSNGVKVTLETYNTGEYPYALEVPSYVTTNDSKNTWFRWCLERHSINDAYWFLKNKNGGNRNKTWYLNSEIKDAGQVVPRTQAMDLWAD